MERGFRALNFSILLIKEDTDILTRHNIFKTFCLFDDFESSIEPVSLIRGPLSGFSLSSNLTGTWWNSQGKSQHEGGSTPHSP